MEDIGGIDPARLGAWLASELGEGNGVGLSAHQPASTGFSADTSFATLTTSAGRREVVFRVERPGSQIFLGTDVDKQVQLMRALRSSGLPAPPVIAHTSDPGLLGRRIIVMDRVAGQPFPQVPGYAVGGWVKDLSAAGRAALWHNALSMLGAVNRLRPDGLFAFLNAPAYGAPGIQQYLGWLTAWRDECLGGRSHPLIDTGLEYLLRNAPEGQPASVIWGDSNPCNMLFNEHLQVSAILDFEATMSGPAEVDLGWWFFLDRSRVGSQRLAGVPNHSESIAIFETALGRPAEHIDYYEIIAGVRMALVIARTSDRLIELGSLPNDSDAALFNPTTTLLADLLGIAGYRVGAGYRDFVAAMGKSQPVRSIAQDRPHTPVIRPVTA